MHGSLGVSTGGTGGNHGGSGSGGSAGSSNLATIVPFADHFDEAPAGAAAGDAKFAQDFCGTPDDPACLKPVGTVVRIPKSLRYFVCIGSLGSTSADLIQTNIPSDQQQGFVPYAVLFFEGPLRPAQSIKWSVEAHGVEFEPESPDSCACAPWPTKSATATPSASRRK